MARERRLGWIVCLLFIVGCAAPSPMDVGPANFTESKREAEGPPADADAAAPDDPARQKKVLDEEELGASDADETSDGEADDRELEVDAPKNDAADSPSPPPSPKADVCTSLACQKACQRFDQSLGEACARAFAAGCFEPIRPDPKQCAVPKQPAPARSAVAADKKSRPRPAEAPTDQTPGALPELFGDP